MSIERFRRKHRRSSTTPKVVTHGKVSNVQDTLFEVSPKTEEVVRYRRNRTLPSATGLESSQVFNYVKVKVGDKVEFRTWSGKQRVTEKGTVVGISGAVVYIKARRTTWSIIYDRHKGLMYDAV